MTQLQIHGNLIYSASDDQTIKAFGMNGEFSKKFVGHSGGIWSFDMAGDMLVTGSTDKTTRIWSVVHGNAVHTLRVHRSTVRAVRLHSGYVVTASRDSTIAVWRLNGSLQHILLGHIQSVRCVDMDSQYVLSGSYDCSVKLWDYRRGQLVRDMPSHRKRVYVVKLYNGYAASGGLDSEVKVSKISGETVLGHSLHKSLVLWLDFAGRYLISSSLDGLIVNYDYINRRVLYTIQETSMIKHQKVYSDFLLIGTAVEAKIYSLRTGKLIRTLLSTYMITRVDMNENVIVVGYSYEGDCYISIFDYRFSKQI